MNELSKSIVGCFEAGDSIVAVDPTMDSGIVFHSKPGSWKVYKMEDDTNTQEVMIVHSECKKFKEDKAFWITEDMDIEVTSGTFGFYDLTAFQSKENLGEVEDNHLNHHVGDAGCLVHAGYGEGLYNLLLLYNKEGEVIAAKVVFIDEVLDEDFDTYSDDRWVDTDYLGLWDKEDFEFNGENNEEDD